MRRVMLVFLLACSKSATPPAPQQASARPPAATTPPPPAVSTVASAAPPPATPPPGADPELARIASAICAATYRREPGKPPQVGCRKPPPLDAPGHGPDGKFDEHTGDLTTFCTFHPKYRGSFTQPGAKEMVVVFDNCQDLDSDGWNGSMPGSAVVVDDKLHVVESAIGVNADQCKQIKRKDGREVLVCQSGYAAPMIGTLDYFFLLDFAKGKTSGTFASLYSDADLFMCDAHQGMDPFVPDGLTAIKIANVTTKDVNGDGIADVLLDVDRAHVAPSKALDAKMHAICTQGKSPEKVLPPPTRARIELLSQGDKYAPSPPSQKLLDAWRADSPNVHQLDGAAPPRLE